MCTNSASRAFFSVHICYGYRAMTAKVIVSDHCCWFQIIVSLQYFAFNSSGGCIPSTGSTPTQRPFLLCSTVTALQQHTPMPNLALLSSMLLVLTWRYMPVQPYTSQEQCWVCVCLFTVWQFYTACWMFQRGHPTLPPTTA